MSKLDLENRPLLYGDPPFEEQLQKFTVRSRARNKIRGASRIMARWPDHWSSTFRIWWLGAGMFFIIVFVVYNCLALAMLNPVHSAINVYWNTKEKQEYIGNQVYMHLFIRDIEEVDLNSYVSNITDLSNKYRNLTFNLIVIINDTSIENLSDDENNKIVMDYLLSNKKLPIKQSSVMNGIKIKRVTLSSYMNNSPLNSHWKNIPCQYMEFLVRAVSVWDNGGVAFNPKILSYSSKAPFLKKLKHILQSFSNKFKAREASSDNILNSYLNHKESHKTHYKNGKRVANNIRDIINNMEGEDDFKNRDVNLLEAETRRQAALESEQKLLLTKSDDATEGISAQNKGKNKEQDLDSKSNYRSNFRRIPVSLFSDHVFQTNNFSRNASNPIEAVPNTLLRQRKSVIRAGVVNKSNSLVENKVGKYQPIFILAKSMKLNENEKYDLPETDIQESSGQLTIDLKGNVIATANKCHAFIGAIFNHAVHRNKNDTVTDFIIAELSTFCKGVLSSCKGIDVILI